MRANSHWQMYPHASTDVDVYAAPYMAAPCRILQPRYSDMKMRILGMCDAPSTHVRETSCMALTLKTERHQIRCAHGPRVEYMSRCAPSSRRRQCSADGSRLYAGSGRAVPKSRPRIGPKSVPPSGSTDSVWNRSGGQFLGPIGVFILPGGKGPFQSRGRQCSAALGLCPIILL